jgi:hypothetical protein
MKDHMVIMQINTAQHFEGGQTGRNLNLHVDGAGFDALECHRRHALDHGDALCFYL